MKKPTQTNPEGETIMAADPTNASLWADADVYIAPIGTAIPADASVAFGAGWTMVGLLDGDAGMGTSRTEDTADHYAWGGILIKTSRKNFKLTKSFTVLEDNATTRSLIWPGSTTGVIIVPVPAKVMVAFETREGGKVHRLITRNYAQIDVAGDMSENETDLSKVELIATIFPSSDKVLFDEQGKPSVTSVAITALTLALSLGGKIIGKLVATATYSDASTADVTALALWSTSNAAKATVSDGYVTGVATGTSNISCTYGGVTATAPSVATVGA